ncbi:MULTISPECIES: VWA domain-containing protein [Microbacterium]|uniref:VWA domain-containing protein n=1 Tax=Microbacterium TaxID=33882 RepID=UPI0027878300|nr:MULTISPECIES: VWA domain-containing protein [Microbacterium]MDQ1083489.1 Mg-chelatase subunit ChlD [Microbacterium sp. SORGH_AS_0344]MDQ1171232.1 Mg-chelatase subunit ChlD [Microbacterium proteolyticum]
MTTRSREATPAARAAEVRTRVGGESASPRTDRAAEVRGRVGGESASPRVDRAADARARVGGESASPRAADLRARLGGEIVLPAAVHATIEAWCSGAPFGLALAGDAHRAETLFRQLRPHADGVLRLADTHQSPPRADRTLALCADAATLPAAVRRRCTAVVDVDAVVPPGRRPPGEGEAGLWRRVIAALAAHGVHDGALDVAACALASALVDTGYDGDPVAVVRAWVAVPHGRGLTGAGEDPGPATVDDDVPESDADDPDEPVGGGVGGDQGGDEATTGPEPPGAGGDDADAPDAVDAAEPGGSDGSGDPADETRADKTGDDASDGTAAPDEPGAGDACGPDADADAPPHTSHGPRGHGSSAPDRGDAGAAAPEAGTAVDGDPDAMPSVRAAALAVPVLTDPPARATVRSGRSARRGATRAGSGRGRPGRIVAPERADGRISMLPSLQRAVHRHAAAGARGELVVRRDDLRGRLRAQPTATHTVVVVDGSSSMGAAGAAHARRVADVALGHVYRDRGDVSVILAAGAYARLVQERTPRVSRARAALQRASAEGGGGTPLADAVRRALEEFADAPRERCRLVIVSDGQPTVDLAGRADPRTATGDLRTQLERAAARAGRCVLVPLDPRGWSPLERTLAPFRAAGVEISAD